MVLHRGAGEGDAAVGYEAPGGVGLLGCRVLDVLGFVQDQRPPGNGGEQFLVPAHCAVAGDDHLVTVGLLPEGVPLVAVRTVVHEHGEIRSEPGGLSLPVADHGGRADQQVGAVVALLVVELQGGQCLDGFSQAHFLRKASHE